MACQGKQESGGVSGKAGEWWGVRESRRAVGCQGKQESPESNHRLGVAWSVEFKCCGIHYKSPRSGQVHRPSQLVGFQEE